MPFNHDDMMDVAGRLHGQETAQPSETARLRSAVSRYYYAALWRAKAFCRHHWPFYDNQPIHENSHQQVIAELDFRRHRMDPGGAKRAMHDVLVRLKALRQDRVVCDYESEQRLDRYRRTQRDGVTLAELTDAAQDDAATIIENLDDLDRTAGTDWEP